MPSRIAAALRGRPASSTGRRVPAAKKRESAANGPGCAGATAGVKLSGYGQIGNVAPQGVHGPALSCHKTKKTVNQRDTEEDVQTWPAPSDRPISSISATALTAELDRASWCGRGADARISYRALIAPKGLDSQVRAVAVAMAMA